MSLGYCSPILSCPTLYLQRSEVIPSLQDAAKTIRDQALHGWAGAAEKLRGAGASVRKVSPATGSLQVENLKLTPHRIGKDNHRDVAMGDILLSMCCCRSFISQTRQSYHVPAEGSEGLGSAGTCREQCKKKQQIHSFRSAASQTPNSA